MDRNSNIRLDPDVVGNGDRIQIPLSDLYELPVFASDTYQKAGKLYTEERQMLGRIRREVFEADGRGKEDMQLAKIRSQIFEAAPQLTVPEREKETLPGPGFSAGIAVIGWIAIVLGSWRLFYRKALRNRGLFSWRKE